MKLTFRVIIWLLILLFLVEIKATAPFAVSAQEGPWYWPSTMPGLIKIPGPPANPPTRPPSLTIPRIEGRLSGRFRKRRAPGLMPLSNPGMGRKRLAIRLKRIFAPC